MVRSSSQVRTPGFHPGNRGSNPLRTTKMQRIKAHNPVKQTFTGLFHFRVSAFLPPFLFIAVGLTIGLKKFKASPIIIQLIC